jgi:integrase
MKPAPTHFDLLVVDSILGKDQPLPTLERLKARLLEWESKYRRSASERTLKAVRADWQVYTAWCSQHRLCPLPLPGHALVAFLQEQMNLGKKRSTLNRYVNTIRLIHAGAQLPDPTHYPDWKLDWRAIVKTLAIKGDNAPRQTQPLATEHIRTIKRELGTSLLDLRDAAMISLASDTLCRESELVSLKLEDITRSASDWSVDVRMSKTDQEGLGDARFCSKKTKAAIDAWCAAAGITSGHIFVAIGRRKAIDPGKPAERTPLAAADVARIVRRRAKQANLPNAARMTGHSGRVGSAIELIENGANPVAVQFAGGWKSQRMVLHYGKRAMAGRNAMADLRKAQNDDESE